MGRWGLWKGRKSYHEIQLKTLMYSRRMDGQIRLQSQSSRSWSLSYCCRHKAQRSWDGSEMLGRSDLLADHLPLFHPNSREEKSRVRAEPERRSRPITGQDLMRETWGWGHLMSASHPLSPSELNLTQCNLIQNNPTQTNPSWPNPTQTNLIQSNPFHTYCMAWMTWRLDRGEICSEGPGTSLKWAGPPEFRD